MRGKRREAGVTGGVGDRFDHPIVSDSGIVGLREPSYGPEATEMLRIPPGSQ
jgi:hypothetical protein